MISHNYMCEKIQNIFLCQKQFNKKQKKQNMTLEEIVFILV